MIHHDEEYTPEWLQKCLKCKHVKIYKRDEREVHCKRSHKGCKFEEYVPKKDRGKKA